MGIEVNGKRPQPRHSLWAIQDNRTQVLAETGRIGSYILTSVGPPKVIDFVGSERGSNGLSVLRDVASPEAAGFGTKLVCAVRYFVLEGRCGAILQFFTINGVRELATTIVNQQQIMRVKVGRKKQ